MDVVTQIFLKQYCVVMLKNRIFGTMSYKNSCASSDGRGGNRAFFFLVFPLGTVAEYFTNIAAYFHAHPPPSCKAGICV